MGDEFVFKVVGVPHLARRRYATQRGALVTLGLYKNMFPEAYVARSQVVWQVHGAAKADDFALAG